MSMSSHPYLPFLHLVSSPSRYTGGEAGSVVKGPSGLAARLALVFPDVYEVGMSHLGSQILYHLVNREPDLACERAFTPWPDLEAELRRRALPLVTLETHAPVRSFDVVGFSLQHELCFTNVLTCLDLAGIPLRAADRGPSDPIVLGGGPCATHPEPVAPFFDALFVGDAEAALPDLLRLAAALRRRGVPREALWEALAATPGVYCPGLYREEVDGASGTVVARPARPGVPERVARVVVPDLDAFPPPTRLVVPWNRAVFDRVSVEIARGCSEGCRFCEAGYTYRPLRDRSPSSVVRDTLATVAATGYEEVSLGALSPADSPGFAPLVHALSGALTPAGVTLTVSSLRAYGLPDQVLHDLRGVRTTGLTLAPEAGSQRLRDVISKNIGDEDMLEAARRAFAGGWQRLKLYFMVGLPTETDDDVKAILDLSRAVLKAGRQAGKRASVTASVGVFVPRPHTPFQWEGMAPAEVIVARQAWLKEASRRTGVVVRWPDARMARLECAWARGDRRLARVLERAWRAGCRFDNWSEHIRHDRWDAAFAAEGIDPATLMREVPTEGRLPWEVIDPLVDRAFLLKERERALEARPTPPCEKPAARDGGRPDADDFLAAAALVCHRCGAGCDPRALADTRRATVEDARGLDGGVGGREVGVGSRETEGGSRETEGGSRLEGGEVEVEAAEPGVVLPEVPDADPEADSSVVPAPRLPTPDSRRPPPSLWHVRFHRLGPAAWLSQKDLVKHLPRILRRAGFEVEPSGGFHPMPRISYCPPVPVGFPSVGEWMDVRFRLPEGVVPTVEALDASSVSGIVFTSVAPAVPRRLVYHPPRYAFLSPAPADEVARLAGWPVEPLGDAPEALEVLGPAARPDRPHACVVAWGPGHPAGRPHEVLPPLLGVDFVPGDFVRLYDDPRVGAPADPSQGDVHSGMVDRKPETGNREREMPGEPAG